MTLIKDESKKTDEEQLLKKLFVTQEEDAIAEFEKEKDEELNENIEKKVAKVEIKMGWNSWAGEGVDTSRIDERKAKAEAVR